MFNLLKSSVLALVAAGPAEEKFTTLPNATSINETVPMSTDSYSGYLNVSDGKALHYVFVASKSENASTDPVLMWFNGGPGCSSLLGLFQENGPWVVDDNETMYENPLPWNSNANLLYIESPSGVGYSIAKNDSDYAHTDMSVSRDAFKALEEWYKKFPEYDSNHTNNELFISGESYAGLYVPYLAYQIVQNNRKFDLNKTEATMRYNLKGTMVGNGATDWQYDNSPSIPETVAGMGLVPQPMLDDFEASGCVYYFNDFMPHDGGDDCDDKYAAIMTLIMDLNIYDLFRTNLIPENSTTLSKEDRMRTTIVGNGQEKTYKAGMTQSEYLPWSVSPLINDVKLDSVFLSDWLNLNQTREALHIGADAPGWDMCSGKVYENYHLTKEGSFWIYPILKGEGIRMMFYSGETDGAIPTLATKKWIKDLNYEVLQEWTTWVNQKDKQVSGWFEKYDGLDFIIVRGVGHMAPQWAREPVLNMINNWMRDQPI